MNRIVVGVLGVVAACVPPAAAPYNGPQPQQPGYASQPPAAANCMQVFQCLAGCAQDAQCFQDCMARGDDASRAAANAVIQCNAAGGDAQCDAELATCREQGQVAQGGPPSDTQPEPPTVAADQPTETMMPGQPHTTANLLPWLTGNWEGNNFHYTFYGDGRVRRASGVPLYTEKTGRYACASIVNETGTVTQQGDLLIMEFAAGEENHCGDKSSAPALTVRNRIVWYQYNGPVELKLVDIDCTRGAMYCSDPIRRR